jgi:hypothetical protein
MSKEWFDSLSIFSIFIGTAVFILISFEVGYQISKYTQSHYEGKVDTSQGPMVGGILAMLAFVLAFTFSMAASRFDDRKETVLNEANAINAAYLRADLIAEPHRTEVKRLLREYVDIRLHGLKKMEITLTRSLELHELLWTQATLAAEQNPKNLNLLLIQSINEVINIHHKRLTVAVLDRIPVDIWLTLYAITVFAMVTVGSQVGLARTRRLNQVIPMVLAFSALITLVADLDRPAQLGLIKISQEAMIDLEKTMSRSR